MKEFNINQLTKEMVVYRLKALEDPCTAAADIAYKTILVAFKDAGPTESDVMRMYGRIIADVCHGAMTGLVLSDQNLAKGALMLLKKMGDAATELNLDPTDVMQMSLRGISNIQKYVTAEQMSILTQEISANFLGAGEFFVALLKEGYGADSKPKSPTLLQ